MKSLRRQLTRALAIATCALFAMGGIGIFIVTQEILQDRFDDTLTAKATALITASEIDDGEFEIDLTVQDFAGFGRGGDDFFEIRHANGKRLAISPSLPKDAEFISSARSLASASSGLHSGMLADGRPARFFTAVYTPKDDSKNRFSNLYLIVASPTRGLSADLWVLACVTAVVVVAISAAIVPVIRPVLTRGLRPVEHLGEQVASISVTQLDRRLDLNAQPEELVPLGRCLNLWIEQLEESVERERRFSSHAAHELRTPLAELKILAESGATWPDLANPDQCRVMLDIIGELESLINKLSLLAHAESGNMKAAPEIIDRERSVHAVLARFEVDIAGRRLSIEEHIEPGSFRADPVLWNTILQNLVGNAISYCPEGGTIRLRMEGLRFSISNPAPDLTQEDVARIFDRFWRKNTSHSGKSHSGLGLSIVRACASALGAELQAMLDGRNDFHIELTLPV